MWLSAVNLLGAAYAVGAIVNGAAAQFTTTKGTTKSRAYCVVRAQSSSLSISQDSYQEAWAELAGYICGGPETTQEINVYIEDVAFAIAESFAEVSTFCSTEGNAEARAQGYALAESRAEAIAEGIASIFASTEVCNDCTAALDSFVQVSQKLVVEAVAEAWTEIYVYSDKGQEASELSVVTSHVIEEAVADVLIEITGTIRAGYEDGCSADIFNSVRVGDLFSECFLSNSADGYTIETDAIAQAGASASAWACDGEIAEAEVDVIAKATAKAVATAIASADVYCESNGGPDAVACGLSESNVRKVAEAQAEAFAETFAEAEDCNCLVSVNAQASVWADLWAEAAAHAYADACVEGSGDLYVADFQYVMEERVVIATARAIAYAVAEGGTCRTSGSVCASTSPQCVSNNRQCGGDGFEYVLPCCSDSYHCIVQTAAEYRCRNKRFLLPGFWDGTVAECTLPEPSR